VKSCRIDLDDSCEPCVVVPSLEWMLSINKEPVRRSPEAEAPGTTLRRSTKRYIMPFGAMHAGSSLLACNHQRVQGEHATFSQNRGRGRGGFRGRGRGRQSSVRCTNCKKYGYKEDDCWSKHKQAQYAEQKEDEYLFMTYVSLVSKGVWYLDSACSNHMTGDNEKFKNLDEALKSQNVHYAPSLAHTLLSVRQLLASGFIIHFEDNTCTVKRRTGEVLLKSTMTSKRMFPVDFSCADVYGMMNCKQESTEVWHQQYGHLYVKGFQLLSNKDMVKEARLEVVHADLCGPMRTESHAGSRKLKILRTDRGGEFLSKEFSRFCDEYGIKRELTVPYTPEQNGIAERKNRTIVEMARSMLKTKNLEDEFWAEAVATVIYLINISPTKVVWNVTPYEAWYESKPSVSHLRIFGCTCYAIISSGRGKDVQFNAQEAWNTNSSSSTNSVDIPSVSITPEGSTSSGSISSESPQEDTDNEELQLRRSKRGNVPKRHFEVEGKSYAFALFVTDPTNAESAINNEVWRRAMQEEIDAIERNGTWKLADLPQGKKAARLVARGYIQEHGIDYGETFSPVARFKTVRVILALAAQMQWTIFQFDVKSAFLNGELKEDVYVQQPEYFEVAEEEHKVYKLKKALYGLKQAPRAWYSKIDEFFHESGFERSPNEPTLYVKRQEVKLLFSRVGCKTVGTPMNVGGKLTSDDGTGMTDARKFRSLVGRLIYLTHTQPDLTYAVGIVSRFMHCPSKQHFRAAKRILRYIAGTTSYGIWYSRKEKFELVGYYDSDWAGEKEDTKSTSGNCFTLGSGVVNWASNKQATVALSSTEGEYVAATKAACQAIWLRRMLSDLNQTQNDATTIFCDVSYCYDKESFVAP
nr:retrovirus-related Pol polyprotein from transposon TNT 1-94 [Tanacetum cinerariifolium]